MKSILRGSGACAGAALLSGFLLFTAKSSPAETLFDQGQQSKSQPSQNPNPEQSQTPSQTPVVTETQNPALASQPQNLTVDPEETKKTPASSEVASSDRPVSLKAGEASPSKIIDASADSGAPVSVPVSYIATAYSLRGRTASGAYVSRGIIAADPRVLPLGSRVRIEAGPWSGEYLVADTGGRIKGRKIDIWTPSSREAMRFGRRSVKLTILSYGGKRKPIKRSQL